MDMGHSLGEMYTGSQLRASMKLRREEDYTMIKNALSDNPIKMSRIRIGSKLNLWKGFYKLGLRDKLYSYSWSDAELGVLEMAELTKTPFKVYDLDSEHNSVRINKPSEFDIFPIWKDIRFFEKAKRKLILKEY